MALDEARYLRTEQANVFCVPATHLYHDLLFWVITMKAANGKEEDRTLDMKRDANERKINGPCTITTSNHQTIRHYAGNRRHLTGNRRYSTRK